MEVVSVNPKDYFIDEYSTPIETAESQIFQGFYLPQGQIALKLYQRMLMEQILLYAKVTNHLHRAYAASPKYVKLVLETGPESFLVHIVPVAIIGLANFRGGVWPCTISPFVDGPTLLDVLPNYQSQHYGRTPKDELENLSATLCRQSDRRNIAVIPWNVKPQLDQKPKVLAVTDICGSVVNLR